MRYYYLGIPVRRLGMPEWTLGCARYGRGGHCIDVKGAVQLAGTFVAAYATV